MGHVRDEARGRTERMGGCDRCCDRPASIVPANLPIESLVPNNNGTAERVELNR